MAADRRKSIIFFDDIGYYEHSQNTQHHNSGKYKPDIIPAYMGFCRAFQVFKIVC